MPNYKNCRYCKKPLPWGKFAYNQDTCISCYSEKTNKACNLILDDEVQKMIKHAIDVAIRVS